MNYQLTYRLTAPIFWLSFLMSISQTFARISNTGLQNIFSNPKFSSLHTASKEFYLSEDEKLTVALCNLVRFDSKAFVNEILIPAGYDTTTAEVSILIKDLKKRKSLFPLMPAFSLFKAAMVHAKDMGTSGQSGHSSSDGRSFNQRIQQFFPGISGVAENYYQGTGEPLDLVMSFLLCKGDLGKQYKENILSENIHYIGISIQPHKTKCSNAVLDFAMKPNIPSTPIQTKHSGEVYWKDCPPGAKISTKRKSVGIISSLFGGGRRK
jgi:hypothetical protein